MSEQQAELIPTALNSPGESEGTPPAVTAVGAGALLDKALANDVSIETIERLAALYEAERADRRRSAFIQALADFQRNMPRITRESSVSFGQGRTSYSFASLPAIAQAIRAPLADAGLSYRFEINPGADGGRLSVTCVLTHTEGHSERTSMAAPPDTSGSKNAIQAEGSTVTYLQRYTLKAALGIVDADEDTDGRAPAETINEGQADDLRKLLAKAPQGTAAKLLEWAGIESTDDLPADLYDEALAKIGKRIRAAQDKAGAADPQDGELPV